MVRRPASGTISLVVGPPCTVHSPSGPSSLSSAVPYGAGPATAARTKLAEPTAKESCSCSSPSSSVTDATTRFDCTSAGKGSAVTVVVPVHFQQPILDTTSSGEVWLDSNVPESSNQFQSCRS